MAESPTVHIHYVTENGGGSGQKAPPSLETITSDIENGLYGASAHACFDLKIKYPDVYPRFPQLKEING